MYPFAHLFVLKVYAFISNENFGFVPVIWKEKMFCHLCIHIYTHMRRHANLSKWLIFKQFLGISYFFCQHSAAFIRTKCSKVTEENSFPTRTHKYTHTCEWLHVCIFEAPIIDRLLTHRQTCSQIHTYTHMCNRVAVSARSRVIVAFIESQCGLWHLRGISNSQHWLPAQCALSQPKPQHKLKQRQYLVTTTTTIRRHLEQKRSESASVEILIAQTYQTESKYFVFFLLFTYSHKYPLSWTFEAFICQMYMSAPPRCLGIVRFDLPAHCAWNVARGMCCRWTRWAARV